MDIGTGSFVGMRILPSGTPGSTDSDTEETSNTDSEKPEEMKGASIVAITRKVSSTLSAHQTRDQFTLSIFYCVQGMGKCIPISQIRTNKTRTGKGIKIIKLKKDDQLADTVVIQDEISHKINDAVISTANGMVVRVPLKQIPSYSNRLTQGNYIVRIREGDEVSNVTVVQEE